MVNQSNTKLPMPEQEPQVRNRNFEEVAFGYTAEMAMEEARRCLNCRHKPCVSGCPVSVQIPAFIQEVAAGRFEAAYQVIAETNALPAVCGRVCPQETQCEAKCVRAIRGEAVGIGRLERFCADWHRKKEQTKVQKAPFNGKRVAVVGGGPASLTCAGDLAKKGYAVTLFEAFHVAGGVLMYGIPEFRLPKEIVQYEIDGLKQLGVEIKTNMVIGRVLTVRELFKQEGFGAVFIGTGAGLPSFMGLEGENLNGVYSANEFLTRINLMKAYDAEKSDTPVFVGHDVAVIGGGNVAMDAARCAKRLGAENVSIVYRRSEQEMPARTEEIHHAKEEGILFYLLTSPKRIIGQDGWVTGMEVASMELGEPDESGRRRPVEKPGSQRLLPVQTVIVAIGQSPNPLIKNTTEGLTVTDRGGIVVEETTGETSIPCVYAGGDAVTGAATVILAMGAGKTAAKAIDEALSGNN